MSDEKNAPPQTGIGDEATVEQRLLDEAVGDFQEALDLARATRNSLSKHNELAALEKAGRIAEDEAISNMSKLGKPSRGPGTQTKRRRMERTDLTPEEYNSQLGSVPISPDQDRDPESHLMGMLSRHEDGKADARDRRLTEQQQQMALQLQQNQQMQLQQNQQMTMMMMMCLMNSLCALHAHNVSI